MNEEQNTSAESAGGIAEHQEFLAANAEYFAQALAPLNGVFRNSGMMNIVCEEQDYTVVVGMKPTEADGELDVDCAVLDAQQQSLKDCINALFI